MNREESYKKVRDNYKAGNSGIYVLPVRYGKTRLGIDISKINKAKSILWVTPSAKLANIDIHNEFIKWKSRSLLKNLVTSTYASLHKVIGSFDLIILDEIQFITENNSKNLLNGKLSYKTIVGLTGTLPEHEEKIEIYKKLNLNILEDITIDDAVDNDIIADYTINVIECNMDSSNRNIIAGPKAKPFKTTEAAQYDYLTKAVNKMMYSNRDMKFAILKRMRAIYNSPTKLNLAKYLVNNLKGRKLIFSGGIEQADSLSTYTYHSKTDDKYLEEFLNGNIDTLSCVNAGGTGFTYTNVNHFIIVQANSNKSGEVTQKIGRALLKQKNYKAEVWVLCLLNTQDEKWVTNALKSFDATKINYINVKNLKI